MVTTWCDALYLMRVPLNMHLTAFTPSHIASCPPPLSPEIVVGHLGSTHGLVPLERNSHDASFMQWKPPIMCVIAYETMSPPS